MLRAVRFATVLRMTIEPRTADAILANAHLATALSGERIQQELDKILLAERPSTGIRLLSDLGLLAVLCPELEICKSIPQDKAIAQDVFEHSLITVDATPPELVLRLAGLFHDVGKAETMADGHSDPPELMLGAVGRKNSPALAGRRADLADQGEEPFPGVQVRNVEHPLEHRRDDPADRRSGWDPQLAHHVVTVDLQIVRGERGAPLDLFLDPGPEVLEGVHPRRPCAAADVVRPP